MDITEQFQYAEGKLWAEENLDRLRERFTGRDLQTQELRDILWPTAEALYKPKRDSMENDVKATAWVAGAMKPLSNTLDLSREGMVAVFEMALEMGSIFGAEIVKHEALELIKEKPAAWWKKKVGELSPHELMPPIFYKWWREVGEPEKRSKTSRAEALKYVMGAREMMAFATIKSTVQKGVHGDNYVLFDVEGEGASYEMVVEDSIHGRGQAGDIVG